MIGNYALHYPLTDFAVSLLAVAALVDVLGRILDRPQWRIAVDWLLFTGFAGVLAAVGSGLWLVSAQRHEHGDALSVHHYFAYATLGVTSVAVVARSLQGRLPKLGFVRTIALVLAAFLVSCAGFVGGKMSHSSGRGHLHTHEPGDRHGGDNAEETMPDMGSDLKSP